MDKLSNFRKALVALFGGVLTVAQLAQAAWVDQAISLDEARGILLAITAALTAAGVYQVSNTPPAA
jgi:hypothetical protein